MLEAENIASSRQYYFINGLLWILISFINTQVFPITNIDFDQYSKANTNRIRR